MRHPRWWLAASVIQAPPYCPPCSFAPSGPGISAGSLCLSRIFWIILFRTGLASSAQLLANTLLYADYTVLMEELRKELRRICEATLLWKGEVRVLQASDAQSIPSNCAI